MATNKRLGIIAAHGTLDAAYPPLILATSAAALDMEAAIFFTFYGLEIIKKGNADKLQGGPDRQSGDAGARTQHRRDAARHDRGGHEDDERLDGQGQRRQAQRTARHGRDDRESGSSDAR